VDERTRALQAASTASVLAGVCDPREDLEAERARALAHVAAGGAPGTSTSTSTSTPAAAGMLRAWKTSVRALLQPDPVALRRHERLVGWMRADPRFVAFKRARPFLEQDRSALYAKVLELQALMVAQTHAWAAQGVEVDVYAGLRAGLGVLGEPGGLDLHYGMFGPTVAGLGTDAQRRAWGARAEGLALVGTYAQTELGHGTHLRGLETTCTVDGDECIVHSPRLASIKWWPGGLGKTATHAAVMARVFGPGGVEVPGIHPVIVPLRDVSTHAPLPGVELGDVGPKLGYNSIDNGFLRLDHVRVPRENLLSRFLPGAAGSAAQGPDAKVSYITMVLIRAQLVGDASRYLQKATCIAVRYNLVRRQGGSDPRDGQASVPRERALLDYPASQADLLPLVAASYALAFASQTVERQYTAFSGGTVGVASDLSLLPELHATCAGLKAVATQTALDGIERCRRACGGHGFSNLSALPTLYGNYAPQVTYEGDNTVLLLQVARALSKSAGGSPAPGAAQAVVLAQGARVTHASALDLEALAGAMRLRATHCIESARTEERSPPAGAEGGFDGAQSAWVRAARAHVEAFLVHNLAERVAHAETEGSPAAPCVRLLGALYAWDLLVGAYGGGRGMGDLLEAGCCNAAHSLHARAALRYCLAATRPLAVLLVDGYALDDFELNYSALGRHDGDVYRALYEAAKRAPWNASDTPPGYRDVLQPLLKHGLPHSKL